MFIIISVFIFFTYKKEIIITVYVLPEVTEQIIEEKRFRYFEKLKVLGKCKILLVAVKALDYLSHNKTEILRE